MDDLLYDFNDVAVSPQVLADDDASSSLSSGTRRFEERSMYSRATAARPGTRSGRQDSSRAGSRNGGRSVMSARPLTARSRAGYSSKDDVSTYQSPANAGAGTGTVYTVASSASNSDASRDPTDIAQQMEAGVYRLLDESSILLNSGDLLDGLDKAKEAGKLERSLVKHRSNHSLPPGTGDDLMFGTWFHLAIAYEQNNMEEDAIKSYTYLSKQRRLTSAWMAGVNLGNMLYCRREYAEAIRSYQMALDQIPPEQRQVGYKICRNIGNAQCKLGKYREASQSFESAMFATSPEHETAFNLLLCQLIKGDTDKAKQVFAKMLKLRFPFCDDESHRGGALDATSSRLEEEATSEFHIDLSRRRNAAGDLIVNAARLIVRANGADEDVLQWTIDKLRGAEHEQLACTLEIELAVQHLRKSNIVDATRILKAFERKDAKVREMASTNLAFLALLEKNVDGALDHASIAVTKNRYDVKALTNLGCAYYLQRDFDKAKDCFLEAAGIDGECVEAVYNLGLTNLELRDYDGAVQSFERCLQLAPNNPEALYWLSRIGPEQYAILYESLEFQ